MVLGLELQRLLVGCLSGTFIYQFLKSFKVLSVYELIKILLVRKPCRSSLFVQRLGSCQSEVELNRITINCFRSALPRKRTFAAQVFMSAECHKRAFSPALFVAATARQNEAIEVVKCR